MNEKKEPYNDPDYNADQAALEIGKSLDLIKPEYAIEYQNAIALVKALSPILDGTEWEDEIKEAIKGKEGRI